MAVLVTPDADLIQRWLVQADIEYYVCDQCHGLHVSVLQSREGVTDARLFIEEDGLLFSVELEVRPSVLFTLQADLTRLNMMFPHLKIFLDINDETLPRLMACNLMLTRAGVAFEQFELFMQATIEACHVLLDDCQEQGVLMDPEVPSPDEDDSGPVPPALH